MATNRLLDLIYAQIPRRLRGRFDVHISSDPYYLRTIVTIVGSDGVPYATDVMVLLDHGVLVAAKIPDWFIGHMALIPVDDNRLAAKLWDSLDDEDNELWEIGSSPSRYSIIQR